MCTGTHWQPQMHMSHNVLGATQSASLFCAAQAIHVVGTLSAQVACPFIRGPRRACTRCLCPQHLLPRCSAPRNTRTSQQLLLGCPLASGHSLTSSSLLPHKHTFWRAARRTPAPEHGWRALSWMGAILPRGVFHTGAICAPCAAHTHVRLSGRKFCPQLFARNCRPVSVFPATGCSSSLASLPSRDARKCSLATANQPCASSGVPYQRV